jgi:hypothetical protein
MKMIILEEVNLLHFNQLRASEESRSFLHELQANAGQY